MSDDRDLENLAAALKRAEPEPDAGRKADAMARAMAEFDRVQGSAEQVRQMSNHPEKGVGFWNGVTAMFNRMTTRAALAGTASIAVLGVAFFAIGPNLTDPVDQFSQTDSAPIRDDVVEPVVTAEADPQPTTPPAVRPRPAPRPEAEVATETENVATPPEETILAEAEVPEAVETPEPVTTDEIAQDASEEAANSIVVAEAPPTPTPEPAEEAAAERAQPNDNIALTGEAEMGIVGGRSDERQGNPGFQQGVDIQFDSNGESDADLAFEAEVVTEEMAEVAPSQGVRRGTEAPPEGVAERLYSGGSGGFARIAPGYVPNHKDAIVAPPTPNTEAYPEAERGALKVVADEPVSTFSTDVDTASYTVARSSINAGYLPAPESVRIEEMINYFPYSWPAPEAGEAPFRTTVSVMETPWNAETNLVSIALKGQMPAVEERPPLNLVFLIDTSGSMSDQNKLPLLIQSFRLMLSELSPEDQVAIVTYAGSAGMVLEPTPASERETIQEALDRLSAGGSTAGQEGLQQAYALARKMSEDGEVSRVLLATDGDFNVGISNPEALKDFIADKRDTGIYLSVLGFGRGNLDDATMQALAQNGNGTASYIDTLTEARKVLVDQLSGALFPIADDVKIQVEWNPATVAEYRLIGYETRALKREDFNNDRVDAGEIGAGHTVTAIYEITPVGSAAVRNTPLRYGETNATAEAEQPSVEISNELGFLRLRYKAPGESQSELIERPIFTDTAEGGQEATFAAAIAGFGQLLSDDTYMGDWGWDEAIALALEGKGDDPFGYRAEAVNLMRLAQSLSR